MNPKAALLLVCVLLMVITKLLATPHDTPIQPFHREGRITILVDAFGERPDLKQDWGFAALIEYEGKRILFDTGNDSTNFYENIRHLRVDLTRLDAVIISHRHADHTAGLRHLLVDNPTVNIYVPDDEAFGGPTPPIFFHQTAPSLPDKMRYFDGIVPTIVPHGSNWPEANFHRVDNTAQIFPGFRLVRNLSPTGQFNETPELSLVIDTPKGQILIVGCSHPGIERILGSVAIRDPHISLIVGGLHLVTTTQSDIEHLALALHDRWKIKRIAPGHCTGEWAFAVLQRVYAKAYVYAGVGTVIDLL